MVIAEDKLRGVIENQPRFDRLGEQLQPKRRTVKLVVERAGSLQLGIDFTFVDAEQALLLFDGQRQVAPLLHGDSATLADHVEGVNAIRGGGLHPGDIERVGRSRLLGVNFEIHLAVETAQQFNRHDLTILFFDRLPLFDLGIRGDVENPLALGDGDPHLFKLPAQDVIRQPGVGVDEAVFDGDQRQIGDARQQFHVGLRADARMPADGDLLGRADARLDLRLFRTGHRRDGLGDQLRLEFDRLIRLGNDKLKRRDPDRRNIHVEALPLGSRSHASRQFQLHLVFSGSRQQQRVCPVARSAQQDLARVRCQFPDGRFTKLHRNFDPALVEHLHDERRRNLSDILFDLGGVHGRRDDATDRRLICFPQPAPHRLLDELEIVGIRDEDAAIGLLEDGLQGLERQIDEPLRRLLSSGLLVIRAFPGFTICLPEGQRAGSQREGQCDRGHKSRKPSRLHERSP